VVDEQDAVAQRLPPESAQHSDRKRRPGSAQVVIEPAASRTAGHRHRPSGRR
jgi:hypothetical protein